MFHLVLSLYLRCYILINDPIIDADVPQKLQPIPLFIADRVTSKRIVPSYNFPIVLVQIILITGCNDAGFYHFIVTVRILCTHPINVFQDLVYRRLFCLIFLSSMVKYWHGILVPSKYLAANTSILSI